MAEKFEDLGLRSELVDATRELGYMEPTALQSAAIPVLRRGGSALLHASAGAGTLAAYGLALIDRLAGTPAGTGEAERGEGGGADGSGVRALILVPTDDAAAGAALSLARFGRAVGVRTAALGPGWAPARGGAAEILVAAPATAVEAIRESRLKLESVESVILDGASAIFALSGQDAVEMVATLVPRDAQRVVVTAEVSAAVEDYAERHLRRALRIPPVPVEVPGERVPAQAEPSPRLDYQIVAEWEKEKAAAALLARAEAGRKRVVYSRSEMRVAEIADALTLRGFPVGQDGAEGEVVVTASTLELPADAFVVSFDPPFDTATLLARHRGGGTVLVTPRELAHLQQIARESNFEIRAIDVVPAPGPLELAEFRERLRIALSEEDLAAQLLVLEPLFREFSPAEVAAAASALLRRRVAPAVVETVRPTVTPAAPAPSPSYRRLFVGVGARDGVQPGDLVGTITGEAQVKGNQIGRIEIRDTFSIVEVESEVASRVIQAVNGITLKGRSVRVDFDRDRRGAGPAARGGERPRRRIVREPGGPRRTGD
jgi:ATP-dependent RNA helicase DeaD